MALGSLTGQAGKFSSLVADSRRDAAPVEPLCALHDFVEVEVLGVGLCYGTAGTVVDDFRRTHRGTCLEEVDTHTVSATCDIVGLHPKSTQRVDSALSYLMFGQFGNEVSLVPVVGCANCHVSLAAAINDIEKITLDESLLTWR